MKTGDTVKVISGSFKGKSARIVHVDRRNNKAMLEGLNVRERHLKKTQFNPQGGKKTVHLGIDLSNLKLEKAVEPAKKSNKKEKK